MRDQVLDRLAETLARFKTENKRKNRDAKHVCSMIMIIDEERRTSRMVCAKNEGLDKVNESFLRNWTACMKAISAKGKMHRHRFPAYSVPTLRRNCIG